MKTAYTKKITLWGAAAAAIILCAAFLSCEPKDWDYILAAPEKPTSFEITGYGEDVDQNISFDVLVGIPDYRIAELNPRMLPGIAYFYRPAGTAAGEDIYSETRLLGDSPPMGTIVEQIFLIPKENLTNGATYIFSVRSVDTEGQLSEALAADPLQVNW